MLALGRVLVKTSGAASRRQQAHAPIAELRNRNERPNPSAEGAGREQYETANLEISGEQIICLCGYEVRRYLFAFFNDEIRLYYNHKGGIFMR